MHHGKTDLFTHTHTRTHTHTHTRTHARTHARTHTHTHMQSGQTVRVELADCTGDKTVAYLNLLFTYFIALKWRADGSSLNSSYSGWEGSVETERASRRTGCTVCDFKNRRNWKASNFDAVCVCVCACACVCVM